MTILAWVLYLTGYITAACIYFRRKKSGNTILLTSEYLWFIILFGLLFSCLETYLCWFVIYDETPLYGFFLFYMICFFPVLMAYGIGAYRLEINENTGIVTYYLIFTKKSAPIFELTRSSFRGPNHGKQSMHVILWHKNKLFCSMKSPIYYVSPHLIKWIESYIPCPVDSNESTNG